MEATDRGVIVVREREECVGRLGRNRGSDVKLRLEVELVQLARHRRLAAPLQPHLQLGPIAIQAHDLRAHRLAVRHGQ